VGVAGEMPAIKFYGQLAATRRSTRRDSDSADVDGPDMEQLHTADGRRGRLPLRGWITLLRRCRRSSLLLAPV